MGSLKPTADRTVHCLSVLLQNPASPSPAPWACSRPAAVERQQLAENLVVGDVRRPTVRGGHSGVKGCVCVGEPLGAGVVEARQRALFERLCRVLVAGNRPLRIAGNRLVHPLDPLGRVEPPVAQPAVELPGLPPLPEDRQRIRRRGCPASGRPGTETSRRSCSACSADGLPGSFPAGATRSRGTGCCRMPKVVSSSRAMTISCESGQMRASYQPNSRCLATLAVARYRDMPWSACHMSGTWSSVSVPVDTIGFNAVLLTYWIDAFLQPLEWLFVQRRFAFRHPRPEVDDPLVSGPTGHVHSVDPQL